MNHRALLDCEGGIQTWHNYDDSTGEVTIERKQDVEPFLNDIREKKNRNKFEPRRDFLGPNGMKLMSIPNVLAEKFNIETKGQFLRWPAMEKVRYVQWRSARDSLDHFILGRV